jgi:restriction system protein
VIVDMPDFQSVMLPLLRLAGDGAEHTMAITIATLADDPFQLTPEQRVELLPGGSQPRFNNRVYWAAAHLRAAGLIASPSRGRFRITDAGSQVLASPPKKISMAYLKQYPGYAAFTAGSAGSSSPTAAPTVPDVQTPDEVMSSAFSDLNAQLGSDLLARVAANPPGFLEKLVLRLLEAMDYGGARGSAGDLLGGPGDEGVDGVIRLDRLGLDPIYVQAKRRGPSHPVTSHDIRNFIGSLQIKNASRGVFITTSTFTSEAREAAAKGGKQIVLIDGQGLAQLMIEHGVGVETQQTYVVKTLDADFFDVG